MLRTIAAYNTVTIAAGQKNDQALVLQNPWSENQLLCKGYSVFYKPGKGSARIEFSIDKTAMLDDATPVCAVGVTTDRVGGQPIAVPFQGKGLPLAKGAKFDVTLHAPPGQQLDPGDVFLVLYV